MPSKTSSFSKALFIKNYQYYWPILFFYMLATIAMLGSQLRNINQSTWYMPADCWALIWQSPVYWSVVVLLATILTVMAIFSYLCRPASTAMINSLPFTRRAVFYSNYWAGLSMLMIPVLVAALVYLITALSLGLPGLADLAYWLFAVSAFTLLTYSLAVSVVMFTGNLSTMALFFFIANYFLIFIEVTVRQFCDQFLYGLSNYWSDLWFDVATPTFYFAASGSDSSHWWVFLIYLLLGIGLLLLARWLYQRRQMERAADVIAIKSVNPVFIYGVALCSSLFFGTLLAELFTSNALLSDKFVPYIICYIITGTIGYFVSIILLQKSFRVFKHYKGVLIYSLIIFLAACSVYYDFYGYAHSVPDREKIVAVAFSVEGYTSLDMLNSLRAASNDHWSPEQLPYQVPLALAQRIGQPLSSTSSNLYDPRYNTIFYYRDIDGLGYNYSSPTYAMLTTEEIQWVQDNTLGIYRQATNIDALLELQAYISQNATSLRYEYRHFSNYFNNYNDHENQHHLLLACRLSNGQIWSRTFPVIISNTDDDELIALINALYQSEEYYSKSVLWTELPLDHINSLDINLDYYNPRYADELSKEEIWEEDMVRGYYPAEMEKPSAISEYADYDSYYAYVSFSIRPEHYQNFLQAIREDQHNGPGFIPSLPSSDTIMSGNIKWFNPDLPRNNLFYEGDTYFRLNSNCQQTINFLFQEGYIDQAVYEGVGRYHELILERSARHS